MTTAQRVWYEGSAYHITAIATSTLRTSEVPPGVFVKEE